MQSFNHVAGGFAMTGLFCSFADVNIFDRFDTMAVVWIAAVLPDIDHTKSILGKVVYPLAKWIQTKYGHRTVTHSLFFYIAIVVLTKGIDNLWQLHFTLPVALALGSHLIFDMCTKQGIPFLYPFSRKPFVLPANPKLRLSANDFRSEAIVFLIFCCLNIFSYPLMAAGFWTRYNKGFATFDHLERERKRKPGDYYVTLLNNADTVRGIIVEQKPAELIVFQSGAGGVFAMERYQLAESKLIDFRKLASKHEFKTVNLLRVSCDSLNYYMKFPVVKVTAQSEQELFYFEGPIMKKGTELTSDYPNGARFQQLAIDNTETEFKIKQLDAEHKAELRAYQLKAGALEKLRNDLFIATNQTGLSDFEEGKRRDRIKLLTDQINQYVMPEPVNVELYQVQRSMLEHKLKETTHLNASLLIWQAQEGKN